MVNNDAPLDINPQWFPVIRRLQSIAKSNGLAVLSISILVDAEGKPQVWTAPDKVLIEPKSAASAVIALFVNRKG